jgi:hypothetical protein
MADYQVKWTGTTTTAVAKEIFQANGTRYSIGYNASYRISGTVLAMSTGFAAKEWSWSLLIKNVAGTTSLVGDAIITELQADAGASAWALALTASNTYDALIITVTGATGVQISWSVYANVDVIGYAETSVTPTKLATPQLIDMIRLHHPRIPHTILAQMLSTTQAKFIRESKFNAKESKISLASQTLVGTSSASPLTLTDGTYSWSFFKDATVDTIILKNNTNVMFYSGFVCHDSNGAVMDTYSVSIDDTKGVSFYDEYGTELENFDSEAVYLTIQFVKQPALLTVATTSIPEIATEYHEALVHHVVSELYMLRADMSMIDRLQISKHYMNMYKTEELKAKFAYNQQSNIIGVTGRQGDDFAK